MKNRRWPRGAPLIWAMVIAARASVAPAGSPAEAGPGCDFSRVRQQIRERMATESVPAVAVAVARHGEIVWEEGFGWADRENRVPATESTMFNVASVTKTFTSTALMILADRKRLDLDRPVDAYLGAARLTSPLFDPDAATVRRVAMHTGGLTTFYRTCYADQAGCRISMDETIRRYGVVFWPPGDHFDYSNLGYGILGEVVERSSGESLADLFRREIFRPLGMNRSSLGVAPGLEKYAAARYAPRGRSPYQETATPGASGAYCSAHDLALFGIFQLKSHPRGRRKILADAEIDAMQDVTVPAGGEDRYGLGWWVRQDQHGYRTLLAQGGTDDTSASLQLVPSEGIAIAVLANAGTTLPSKVVDEILSQLLPKYGADLERKAKETATPAPDLARPPAWLVGNWAGTIRTYRGAIPLTFAITESGPVLARLGALAEEVLADSKFDPKFGTVRMRGKMAGSLAVDDAGTAPYDLYLELYVRGKALAGCVTTLPRPGSSEGNALSFWVELTRR